MTEGTVDGGRLSIDAYIDTAGATRGLKQRLDQQLRNVRAKIKAEIDSRGIVTSARAAAREASDSARVRFVAEIDTRALIPAARAAAAAASEAATVKIRADLDKGSVAAATAALTAASSDRTATIEVDADTAAAAAQIETLRQQQSARRINLGLNVDPTGLNSVGSTLMRLGALPAIVGGIYALGTAAVSAAGGLLAMGAAAAQASSALALLPNLAGTAVQGISALVIGFTGVGDAVGALGQQQQTAAADTKAAADTQAAAARRIADARYALGEALHQQADQEKASSRAIEDARRAVSAALRQQADDARQSARAIADAERRVRDARAAERVALGDLNDARAEAIRYIRDLRRELKGSATDEIAAADALKTAQERLADVRANAASTDSEKRDALTDVRQAQDALAEARDRRADLKKENAKATADGVEGTDIMIDARKRVADASRAEADAERSLAEARRDAATRAKADADAVIAARESVSQAQHAADDQARASARTVALAQRELADAQKATTAATVATSAASTAAAAAMAKLSPAGQAFAKFLSNTLIPRFLRLRNAVQQALLPPIQRALTSALPLLGTLQVGLVDTATRIGAAAEGFGKSMGSAAVNADVSSIMASNNRALTDFLGSLGGVTTALRIVATVAGPVLLEPFAKWTRKLGETAASAAEAGRASGEMAAFLTRARDRAVQLGDIVGNLTGALTGLGEAAIAGAGNDLMKSFQTTTQGWQDFVNSDAGKAKMDAFFKAVTPVTQEVGSLIANVGELFAKLAQTGAPASLAFVGTLNAIVQGLSDFAELGGGKGGLVLGWLFSLVGFGGALSVVAGAVLKMAGSIGFLTRLLGLNRAAVALWAGIQRVATAAALGTRIQLLLQAAATKAAGVAMTIWRGATILAAGAWKLLSRAFVASPIGVIIALILAVGAAVVYAYKRFDGFRKVVDAVFGFIVDKAKWLWDVLFGHSIFPDMLKAFRAIFKAIAVVFRVWWAGVKAVFKAVGVGVRAVGAMFTWLWKKAIKPAFNLIGAAAGFLWRRLIKPAFRLLRNGVQAVGDKFSWLWKKGVKPAFAAIKDGIDKAWKNGIRPVFNRLKDGLGNVVDAFRNARRNIGTAWSKLTGAVKVPIRGVLGIVNKWVIDKFNWVSDKLNGPKIARINVKGLRDGGTVPGYSPNATADNIPIMATAREFMVRRPAAERLRKHSPGLLEYINRFGRLPQHSGVEGAIGAYARGGLVRAGQWASDGVQRLARGGSVFMDGKRLSTIAARQIALAERIAKVNFRVLQGGYGGSGIAASGTSHRYSGVADVAPASVRLERIMRQVGFAAWARNIPGRSSVGSGQHIHAVSLLDPGNARSPQIYGSWRNNGNGLSGANNDPAGHPPWLANLRGLLGGIQTSALGGGGGGGGGIGGFLSSLGGKVAGIVKAPGRWLLDKIKAPLRGFTNRFGGSALARMLGGMPRGLIDAAKDRLGGIVSSVKDKFAAAGGMVKGALTGGAGRASGPVRDAVRQVANTYGWGQGDQWAALGRLIQKESSWNPRAANPTTSARGLFQKMTSLHGPVESTPQGQAVWGLNYIKGRYGDPIRAWAHHLRAGYYDTGGSLYPGSTFAVNATGKTETIFTNSDMVAMSSDLRAAAAALRQTIAATRPGGGGGALVENLSITGRPQDVPNLLRDANYELRKIRMGGVYARGPA